MSDVADILHHLFGRFGRPDQNVLKRATDENMAAIDDRLTTVEQRQREIAARLRILEKAGNPRGIGRDD